MRNYSFLTLLGNKKEDPWEHPRHLDSHRHQGFLRLVKLLQNWGLHIGWDLLLFVKTLFMPQIVKGQVLQVENLPKV